MRRRTQLIFTHDSFLDIMFNMVGGLVLLAIMSALASGNIRIKGQLPVVREVKEEIHPIVFECRDGGVWPLTEATGDEAQEKLVQNLQSVDPETWPGILDQWNKDKKGGEYYWFEFRYTNDGFYVRVTGATYHPREGKETPADLDSDAGAFRRTLAWARTKAGGKKILVTFLVRSDSFEIYKRARAAVEAGGMLVSLRFLSKGEAIQYTFGAGKIQFEQD